MGAPVPLKPDIERLVEQEEVPAHWAPWRRALHVIIFRHDTPGGRAFDLALIVMIVLSVAVVMLDSVESVRRVAGPLFYPLEWFFTIVFTVEYVLRLVCTSRPVRYARSFYGVVDLLSILPSYLSMILPGSQYLQVVRVLRVLRIFRILKLGAYIGEANTLMDAIRASRRKLAVFMATVATLSIIFGAVMHLIEGQQNGFESIPRSIYWTIVTITTVGYGDISPKTTLGRAVASGIMLLGYAIVAVPTGIVTMELTRGRDRELARQRRVCTGCGLAAHDSDAAHCKLCGTRLASP